MQLRSADGFTQLVAHLFAHVPLAGPGNLADPRYIAWARARIDPADRATLDHDAALLARLWAADPGLDVLHGLCDLHADLDGFRATTTRSLADLVDEDVADPALLGALRGLDAAELVHASLSVMLAGFVPIVDSVAAALELAGARVRPWLERLRVHVPELDAVPIELVFAMGEHGRALADRILVGAPAAWNEIDPANAAMLAAHEALVRSCEIEEYAACERWAIAELSSRLRAAEPELRTGHGVWLDSLDRSKL